MIGLQKCAKQLKLNTEMQNQNFDFSGEDQVPLSPLGEGPDFNFSPDGNQSVDFDADFQNLK